MTELGIDVREEAGLAHVVVQGEFDLAGIQQFEDRVRDAETSAPRAIVIDLSDVEFMDSSGLRALVMASERAEKAGRRLAIVPGPPQVRRVFEITQLDSRLDLVEDASAVAAD